MRDAEPHVIDMERPAKVIPFPSRHRVGHASKVALQLSKARTNREADNILSRAVDTHTRQMIKAGIPVPEIGNQRLAYKVAIAVECARLESRWAPVIERRSTSNPEGAA